MADEGIDNGSATAPGHPDFRENGAAVGPSRIAYNEDYTTDPSSADCGGHGTNVASIAAGYNVQADALPNNSNNYNDSQRYNYGLGVAPRARIGGSKVFNCGGVFNPTAELDDVAGIAYAAGARISNNSWGNTDAGVYSSESQDYDRLVRDASPGVAGNQQLVEVFAAGNFGDREPGRGQRGLRQHHVPWHGQERDHRGRLGERPGHRGRRLRQRRRCPTARATFSTSRAAGPPTTCG